MAEDLTTISEMLVTALTEMQRSQERRDLVFAELLGEMRASNERISQQTERISQSTERVSQQLVVCTQILERVIQTTDRTERMTAEVLTRIVGRGTEQ